MNNAGGNDCTVKVAKTNKRYWECLANHVLSAIVRSHLDTNSAATGVIKHASDIYERWPLIGGEMYHALMVFGGSITRQASEETLPKKHDPI